MRIVIACLAAALAASTLSAPVRAEEASQAAAVQPSSQQLELTRRYLRLMMSDQLKGAIEGMITGEAALDPNVRAMPDEDRRFMIQMAADLTHDLMPQMIEEMVPVYASVFTEAELVALLAFYDTEMGRSILDKTIAVMPEANRAVLSVMPQMLDKMAARMCQHYGCEPGELEELQRGMREEAGLAAETSAPRRK